ncbi:hypothetical protein WG908_03430 [Sphingobium sp. AN641]|uniref:hypothetical protein n=1 Tax=Sphingobium sp. AN641 TaxID=3133443 RepID=UPI0030BF9E84
MMAIDWLTATVEQRKTLYRVVKRLLAEEGLNWNDFYSSVLGKDVRVGGGYEDNFRAGRIGRDKAQRIVRWLAAEYPHHAARLKQDANAGAPSGERWLSFVARHRRFERVAAVLLPEPSIGIVAFAKPEPLARPVIPLGAPFCFEVESDRQGAVIAFQSVGDEWYALPLRPDGLSETIAGGRQFLPRQANGEPIPLSEDVQDGRHGFLFLIASIEMINAVLDVIPAGVIYPPSLDRIADIAAAGPCVPSLLRINLLFAK